MRARHILSRKLQAHHRLADIAAAALIMLVNHGVHTISKMCRPRTHP